METVTIESKVDFINELLKSEPIKGDHECAFFLRFLRRHKNIIPHVHFVDNVDNCPFGIIMQPQSGFSLHSMTYYIKGEETDLSEILMNIGSSRVEKIYINIIFPEQYKDFKYLKVLEDNPYKKTKDNFVEFQDTTDFILEEASYIYEKKQLEKEKALLEKKIDLALEEKNEKAFYELTTKLNALKI